MKQIVLVMVCLFFVVGMAIVGRAEVNISIGVPPPLEFPAPPDVVVVPSEASDVYLVPNTAGLYFFGGLWYRFHEDHWFRSSIYNGSWAYVETPLIPPAVAVIPPDYILGVPPGYHRIHYGDFHGHWRYWGNNHYWNRQPWYREHAEHHWGGREFHKSTEAHHTDIHHGGDLHHGKESTDKGGKDTRSKEGLKVDTRSKVGSSEKTVGTGTKTVTGTKVGTGTKTVTGTKVGTGTKTVTGTKVGTGTKTVTGTKVGTGTKTVTGTKVGTGTKTVTGTKAGTGTKVGTAKTSGGGGHGAVKTGGTGSKATHSEKQK